MPPKEGWLQDIKRKMQNINTCTVNTAAQDPLLYSVPRSPCSALPALLTAWGGTTTTALTSPA